MAEPPTSDSSAPPPTLPSLSSLASLPAQRPTNDSPDSPSSSLPHGPSTSNSSSHPHHQPSTDPITSHPHHQPSTDPTTSSPSPPPRTLRIGTRASALALAQTELFRSLLAHTSPQTPTSIHPMTTSGDHNQTTPLHVLATNTPDAAVGKSLWTHELEARLLAGELDCIVHSLKDVPTTLVKGCVVRTVGGREESRDCVVMRKRASGEGKAEGGYVTLGDLPPGSVVGTSSLRRAAMIRRRWPELVIKDVRGNVGTRLAKLDDESKGYDALVLAGAGVQRLGWGHRVSSWLSGKDGMLGAVGQGALGVEFLEGDEWVRELVESVEVKKVGWACVAERGLLAELEGGCSVPVGVETEWVEDESSPPSTSTSPPTTSTPHLTTSPPPSQPLSQPPRNSNFNSTLHLSALIVSPSGQDAIFASRRERIGSDKEADECGRELARELVRMGAGRILEGIYREREEGKEKDGKEEGKEEGR